MYINMMNKKQLYTNQTISRWEKKKGDILLSQLIKYCTETNLAW